MNSSLLHPESKKKVTHDSVWWPSQHWWRQGEQGPPWTTRDAPWKRTGRAGEGAVVTAPEALAD